MSLRNRLDRLERSPGLTPRPLTLFHSTARPLPVPPPGCDPVTIVCEVVVDRIEPDGTECDQDPWDPDRVIIVRPGEAMPDRTPPAEVN